mmetsp:Transcript_9311/g.13934  ORF Transcript_9311/g.13934 Transcript_9311/m.13934 type:complete len:348 (+) Transcript_9311:2406-3449(+)
MDHRFLHSFFIIYQLLMSGYNCVHSKDNIVKPVSSYNFIIAESDGGLSNRLRVLISHMFLAEVLHNNAHLVFIWDVNDACPGHFLQIFKPIPRVTFTTSDSIINGTTNATNSENFLNKYALKIYPRSRDGFEQTMLNYDVNLVVKKRAWWNIQLRLWENIIPTREIEEKVEDYVKLHNVCNMTSMHIRKTDLDLDLQRTPKKLISYDLFYRWVEKQKTTEPIFLMTDNRQTQEHFQIKYNTPFYPIQKILVYSNITDDGIVQNDTMIMTDTMQISDRRYRKQQHHRKRLPLAVDHRFTSLEHAIIDILIAAHAWDFRPAPFSSVSDLVKMFNFLHRWQWCGCTFRGC